MIRVRAERDGQVDVEIGENAARATVTETREVAERFDVKRRAPTLA